MVKLQGEETQRNQAAQLSESAVGGIDGSHFRSLHHLHLNLG